MLVPGDEDFLADVVYIVLELALAFLAILGNILVCWAVCLNSNLQSVTNFFVASLAAADIAVGLLAIPFAITISTGFCAAFHGCLFIACFVLVLTQSSIFSLLAIAIDRVIAIRLPLRYKALVTASRAKGIIAFCWFLSFIIGLTPMLGWHKENLEERGENASSINCSSNLVACFFETVVTMEYMVYYNFFACVLVPLLLMFGIYLKIFMAARRQLKQMENKLAPGEQGRSVLQKEVHAAKSLAIIVGLFAGCWLPLHFINCFIFFCNLRPPLWAMNLAILLSHANSVVNPLIYAYRIREFRQTFRKIIWHHILGKKESFKSAPASRRTSAHEGEADDVRVPISENALHFLTWEDVNGLPGDGLGKERNAPPNRTGLVGELNGHLGPSCKNGELSRKAQIRGTPSQELLGAPASYGNLESSLEAASGS